MPQSLAVPTPPLDDLELSDEALDRPEPFKACWKSISVIGGVSSDPEKVR